MNELGITVLRFEDHEIYFEIDNVLRGIENFILYFKQTHP